MGLECHCTLFVTYLGEAMAGLKTHDQIMYELICILNRSVCTYLYARQQWQMLLRKFLQYLKKISKVNVNDSWYLNCILQICKNIENNAIHFYHFGKNVDFFSLTPISIKSRNIRECSEEHLDRIPFHYWIVERLPHSTHDQGCQIFIDTIYQNGGKCTRLPLNYQMTIKHTKWT
jgi:hypothetical protein